ncbi:3-deoxy-D-manno-octulosonic acid transferase [Noviherbaspirillum pedocola]|uniref:3-deoxy-D-manno-octulosonic acid transferase n=1 Tax=Noviherbaspirillum pedocola TaxID=2801341 RepID=UPI001F3B9964|nr:3-deoxy-D-manno-octulosonic acid transferase [Noviherbaspirillum pedocola]
MRWLYSFLWWLSLPLALLRLWWRGRKEPGYRQHIGERLGFYDGIEPASGGKLIWLHAVSVGETRAAEPLIGALLDVYPDRSLLLTHMTPTGRATGAELYAKYGDRLRQVYLPYDIPWIVRRFLKRFQPRLCILMETEVWPNLIAGCNREGVPVALVNARLSERSLKRSRRFGNLLRVAAEGIACVAAQTEADAARLRAAGGNGVEVTGNIKFDVNPKPALLDAGAALKARFGGRPVLLCASTREGEEALILDALERAVRQAEEETEAQAAAQPAAVAEPVEAGEIEQAQHSSESPIANPEAEPGGSQTEGVALQSVVEASSSAHASAPRHHHLPEDALLVIVPRHPQRFNDVAAALEARGIGYCRRSTLVGDVPADIHVMLGDSMGEMFAYYVASDLAFIGGSLMPLGGQNLIEACAVGTPVLIGPHTFNFAAVSDDAVAAGAALRVKDADDMLRQAALLLNDKEALRRMAQEAQGYAYRHRGATARTVWLLAPLLG